MDKILVLNPMRGGGEFFKDYFADSEDVDVISLDQGARIIATRVDVALAGFDSVIKAREAEKAGYKAIILTCHDDPNLFPLREAVSIPVLGVGQTTWHFCSMLASRFSIISPREVYEKHAKEDLAASYGFGEKLISVRLIPFEQPLGEVGQLSRQKPIPENLVQLTMNTCIKAIEEDGAPAITFGCAYLANIIKEVEVRLKAKGLGVTIINPMPLTIEVARLLIKMKLTHSAAAFPLADPSLE